MLKQGNVYSRKDLAHAWGLGGFQALGRGVYTPSGTNSIILFVTREKQKCLTQYNDFIQDDLLFWEGENGHGNDDRIANASQEGDEIYLFYRARHHSDFVYYGRIILTHFVRHHDKPSEFVFNVIALTPRQGLYEQVEDVESDLRVAQGAADDEAIYKIAMTEARLNSIDKQVLTKSRGLGQRYFRGALLKLWTGECAVTGTQECDVLLASHIKPWKDSAVEEKIDPHNGLLLIPNLDKLLDTGLISFDDRGKILVSGRLNEPDRKRLNIHHELYLRVLHPQSKPYLHYHRENRFRE